MKKLMLILCGFALINEALSQAVTALENKPHSLQERYYLMKTQAETYNDYKVIREYVLDAVWKMTIDSLESKGKQLAIARVRIDSLQKRTDEAQNALKLKTDSMADVVFAGSHIRAMGWNFSKSAFLGIIFVVVAGLFTAIAFLFLRMNQMQRFVNESKLIVTSINGEFEDYKHKALEKQTKLARELQTERNKLLELKQRGTQ